MVSIGLPCSHLHPLLTQHSALTDPSPVEVLIALCWRRLSRILPSGRFRLPVLQRSPALTDPSPGEVSIAGLQPPRRPESVHPPSPRKGGVGSRCGRLDCRSATRRDTRHRPEAGTQMQPWTRPTSPRGALRPKTPMIVFTRFAGTPGIYATARGVLRASSCGDSISTV